MNRLPYPMHIEDAASRSKRLEALDPLTMAISLVDSNVT